MLKRVPPNAMSDEEVDDFRSSPTDNLLPSSSHSLGGTLDEPTTKSEILGWCMYAWAAEPFIVSAVSTYVPLLLEQFARENGVRLDDHLQPCILPQDPMPPILPPPSNNGTDPGVQRRGDPTTQAAAKCVVYVLGHFIDTSSFALYTFSLSVLVQTLTVISMSGAADKGNHRKRLLVTFGVIGAFATICFVSITSKRYYIASLLAIIANSAFGGVNVCGNSFLPILVDNYPLPDSTSRANLVTKISGIGAASGYVSALICQIVSMFIILRTGSTTESIQYAICFIGAWWLLFQIPLMILLKARQTSHLELNEKEWIVWQYVKYGWHTLFVSIKHASMLRDVIIYLVGWFIVSDSITTINSAAVLFAKTELQMSTPDLVIVGILTVTFAIFGSLAIPVIQRKLHITPKLSLIFVIVWASCIPFYGILGFYFKEIGLKHKAEMYVLAVWYGISMGGLATLSRSLFSLLIPRGNESVFFSLFSVTDKGSSILGPVITGLIVDRWHDIRYCFYFLFGLLVLAVPVFAYLNVARGEKEARELEIVED